MKKRFLFLFVLLLVVLSVGVPAVSADQALPAETPQPGGVISDNQVNDVASQLYCPVCENIPLDVCPTQACAEWRELIRLKLSEGWDDEEIKDYFVEQYGDRVLQEPPRRGLHWLVYILPPVFFLIGLVIVILVIRNMRTRGAQHQAVGKESADKGVDPYLEQMERELKRRKESE